ncbi:MAG: hypothetical protein NVSMB51_17470 [Solirubrobacteraceae bacterium]
MDLAQLRSRRTARFRLLRPRPVALAVVALVAVAGTVTACGGPGGPAYVQLDLSQTPHTVGPGAAFRPPLRARPPACRSVPGRFSVHLELFADSHVVLIPAGIGIAPPLVRDGVYVRSGRCAAQALTHEPTGVIETASGVTLGSFFRLWGRALGPRHLAGFGPAPVSAFVNGARVTGDPARIRLGRHAEIVLEIGGYVPPHRSYRFPSVG